MNFEDKESVKSNFLKKTRLYLYKKHNNDLTNKYNILKINEILSNSKSRLVSLFKDYLLYEDYSEFLKRYYNGKESKPRIKKISKYFNNTLFIYPNYSSIEESKYILGNILKKQMIINKQKRNKLDNKYLKKNCKNKKFFNNSIYDDILGLHKSESFINILFGLDSNKPEEDNDDNDELNKLINIIENNEKLGLKELEGNIKKNKNLNNKITVNTLNSNLKKKNKQKDVKIIFNRQKRLFQNEYLIKKENPINFLSKENITITNNEETKDTSNTNAPYIKQKLVNNYKSMIYHRKIKSNLSGNVNKLDLPSNSNIVNLLKMANEAFAEKNKNNNEELNKNKNDPIYDSKSNILAYFQKSRQNKKLMSSNNINKIIKNKTIYKKDMRKLTRNIDDNKSAFCTNKSCVYIKTRAIKSNRSNGNIFKSMNDENNNENKSKLKIIKPYSRPKYVYKENINNHMSNRSNLNSQKESIFIENIK